MTFTAPAAGASGTFDAVATVPTDALGIATAPAFTANQAQGTVLVTATAPGLPSVGFILTNTGVPTAITAAAGTPQKTTVGTAFSTPLQAKVTAAGKTPVSGITVVFALAFGGGTFAGSAAVLTNAQGVATAPALTAGTPAGTFTVFASVAGVAAPAKFTLTNLPGAAVGLQPAAGQVQSGTVGKPYPTVLEAQLVDQYGNPVSQRGAKVAFTVVRDLQSAASATFPGNATTAMVSTDGNGLAKAPILTANTSVGHFLVTATVAGFNAGAATFVLTNVAGAVADPSVSPAQTAVVGQVYAQPLLATVHDAFGNPLGGVAVTFSAPATGPGGTFGGKRRVTVVTGSDGVATAPAFTADTRAGSFAVSVVARAAHQPALIRLTNLAGPPADLSIVGGKARTAAPNAAFHTALEVRITDGFGNAVSGVPVTFTVQPNAATGAAGAFAGAPSATAVTDEHGHAIAPALKAGGQRGTFTVTASSAGVADAVFDLTIE